MRDIINKILKEEYCISEDELLPAAELRNDLRLDSLDIVELVLKIEDVTGKEIPDSDFAKLITVDDLVKYVEKGE